MSNLILVCGLPASGKSSLSQHYIDKNYKHLNRDKAGGKVIDLLPKAEALLVAGHDVVLDNVFATKASRQPFIQLAKKLNISITCEWMTTSVEDCSINALNRMWDRYQTIFYTIEDIRSHNRAKNDPNMFPIVVLFKTNKEFETPTILEGFEQVKKTTFKRKPYQGKNKAIIFDYDDTLRTSVGEQKYPVVPTDVSILPRRKEKLTQLKKDGWLLLGVSNQSGIARGHLSNEDAKKCFEATNKALGQEIKYLYCPHNVPPSCYCRKPQSGLGIRLIREYDLDVAQCIFVGDQTTDKTFAKRLGFQYKDQSEFFK